MKTIHVTAKCSDLCYMSLHDSEKGPIGEHDGYVPNWFPSPDTRHYGDYVELDIDLETGKILNWKKPTQANLKETFAATKAV